MKSQQLNQGQSRYEAIRTASTSNRVKIQQESNIFNLSNKQTTMKAIKRPQTSTSNKLATKKWRAMHFHSGSPASRREVELLGEWLNSVLADNIENNDNPLDIVTNAQHWFSVAFNELVRQVSITCAERGRLYACIWKRNQDLFQKLIEIQRQEREYILACHKDRVQFLRTDLEFCNSRLSVIEGSYEEEQQRWKENHEREISKFDNLQEKIDQQVKDRKQLQQEINELEKQLGIESRHESSEDEKPTKPIYSFTYEELISRLQKMKTDIRNNIEIKLEDINELVIDIQHYLEFSKKDSFNIRVRFENLFLSLPPDAKPNIRTSDWVEDAISYIYSTYIVTLSQAEKVRSVNTEFSIFIYQIFLRIFGNRNQAEQTLFDLFSSAKNFLDEGHIRITLFLRFIGLLDPLPTCALHYYLYCIKIIAKQGATCLFPKVESNDAMVGGININVASQASQQIIGRFAEGRMFKFYNERIDKISNSGFLKFGGRPIADLDSILEFLLTAFLEEKHKIEEAVVECVRKLPSFQVWTYSEMVSIAQVLKTKPTPQIFSDIMVKCLREKEGFPIRGEMIVKFLEQESLTVPFEFVKDDFTFEPSPEDIRPFIRNQLELYQAQFDELLDKLVKNGDDIQVKQLKAAKVKFDQNLSGRASFKVFEHNVCEFFEKLNLYQFF